MDIFYVLGMLAAPVVLLLWARSHNQPGEIARLNLRCGYCPWTIKKGQKMVHGHRGWGHVECVPKVRRRIFNRW